MGTGRLSVDIAGSPSGFAKAEPRKRRVVVSLTTGAGLTDQADERLPYLNPDTGLLQVGDNSYVQPTMVETLRYDDLEQS